MCDKVNVTYQKHLYNNVDMMEPDAPQPVPIWINGAESDLYKIPRVRQLQEPDVIFMSVFKEGNDGTVFKMIVLLNDSSVSCIGKHNKRGISIFMKELLEQMPDPTLLPGLIPIAQVKVKDHLIWIYDFFEEAKECHLSEEELVQGLWKQVMYLHSLGFNHMDIAPRNVIRSVKGYILIDFNLVVKHGMFPILPIPTDVSSENVKNRRCVVAEDDFTGFRFTMKHLGHSDDIIDKVMQNREVEIVDQKVPEVTVAVDAPDARPCPPAPQEYAGKTEIDLSWKDLSKVPTWLRGVYGLTRLDLWKNRIRDISSLHTHTDLTKLNIGMNKIADISVIGNMPELTYLDMRQNQITDLSALEHCLELRLLFLQQNNITDLTPLRGCNELTLLHLAGNQITDLSALRNCTELTELHLDNNRITDLTPLEGLVQVKKLYLEGNPVGEEYNHSKENGPQWLQRIDTVKL